MSISNKMTTSEVDDRYIITIQRQVFMRDANDE